MAATNRVTTVHLTETNLESCKKWLLVTTDSSSRAYLHPPYNILSGDQVDTQTSKWPSFAFVPDVSVDRYDRHAVGHLPFQIADVA